MGKHGPSPSASPDTTTSAAEAKATSGKIGLSIGPFSIQSINNVPGTQATLSPPGPWPVTGQVGSTGHLANLAYQVGCDGTVTPIPIPMGNPAAYSFNLTADDVPGNSTFTLWIYAWDDTAPPTNFAASRGTLICQGFNLPPDVVESQVETSPEAAP